MLIIKNTEQNEIFLTNLCHKFESKLNSISLPNDSFRLEPFFSEKIGGYWVIHIFLDNDTSSFFQRYWYHCHSCQILDKKPVIYHEYRDTIDKLRRYLKEQFSE
ncbi:hypothetical protein D920_01938 [Enterococcus faecalis 13-SD-W-01]|nr:hypothetical protein D920_01938 [Enterococcus faecalis 13-SD-W-01]